MTAPALASPGPARPGLGRRAGWLALLPAALLLGVAAHQLVLARRSGLSPWSGGGFGMFATTDAGATRHLHAFVLRPGLRRELDPARIEPDALRRALTLPSPANLRELAEDFAALPTPDHGPPGGVEIQVWRTRFDPDALTPEGRMLASFELPLASD